MYFRALVIFCLSIVHPFICLDEMDPSDNPILEYLGMEPHSVVEHELVEIDLSERLRKRELGDDGRPLSFRAFGNPVDLWLSPSSPILASDETPVYFSRHGPNAIREVAFSKVKDAMKSLGRVLEDPNHSASVILGTDDTGRPTVTGYLRSKHDDSSLVIRYLPAKVIDGYLRKRRSIDDVNDDFGDSMYHVVLKLRNDDTNNNTIGGLQNARTQNSWHSQREETSEFERVNDGGRPDTLYPKILLQVDYTYHDLIESSRGLEYFLEYIMVFWNSVDMIYRQFQIPKIRFHIAAIIIAQDPKAVPFIANNVLEENAIEVHWALEDAERFFHQERATFPFSSYDFFVVMTRTRLGRIDCYKTLGLANAAICLHKGSLVRDSGAFAGIQTAAHEIGHLFDLPHLGNYADSQCDPRFGFIMGANPHLTSKSLMFSSCSLNAVKEKYEKDVYNCSYTPPVIKGKSLPLPLPEKMASVRQQCLAYSGGEPCDPGEEVDICVALWCIHKRNHGVCIKGDISAAPGTPCTMKDGRTHGRCLANRCVAA